MKNNIYLTAITVLLITIIVLLLMYWKGLQATESNYDKKIDDLKKSIIASDQLTKEAEGRYAKLIDYYASKSDLSNQLKKIDGSLFNIVKNQNEKLLNITNAIFSFESKLDSGIGRLNPLDTNQIDIALTYPSIDSPFISWNGYVNRKTSKYRGDWKFGRLPISIVVTEDKEGFWKHRIIGPDWVMVDSLSVKSLPPKEYSTIEEKKLQFFAGVNYLHNLATIDQIGPVGVGVGLNYDHTHKVVLNINTAQQLGFGYYYNFRRYKNKKK
jgi:hypothetical protein